MTLSRWEELMCVLFGHSFNESGNSTDTETGIVTEEYIKCSDCGIELHDRSGSIELYELKYGGLNE